MDVIEKIVSDGIVEQIITNIGVTARYKDDLIQEIYLILMEYDRGKLEELYNKKQIAFFITRIIKNQYNSSTSPFYKKYRKYYEIIENNIGGYTGIEDDAEDEHRGDYE